MKAMLLEHTAPIDDHPLSMVELPIPQPKVGEILIEIKACGVCHTDLHTVEGDLALPLLPLIPGHQVVGIVKQLGAGCSESSEGDRVGITWFFSSCGTCKFCLEGRENLCSNARFTGYHVPGGYAQYMIVPESSAFPIPDAFSDVEATPLLCGGVIGFRSLRLTGAKTGEKLGLYGFGNSAHIVLQLAVKMGCRVHVFTRSTKHRELARDLGAAWVGTADEKPPEPMNSSIIFAPAGSLVPQALAALDKGGTLTLAGITMSPIPEMDYSLVYGERTIRSVANTTRKDALELLQAASEVPVRTVVDTFPLEQANEVLMMMKTSALKAGAALIP
jgi:propanol-preferring alcohol dehydrogenase